MEDALLDRICRSIEWLEEQSPEKFSVDAMADIACLSPYHFSRVFLSLTGLSPALYHRRRLLSEAAIELLNQDRRILDVAVAYGYESQEAFTRAFKKMFGVNPGDVRNPDSKLLPLYQKPLSYKSLNHFKSGGLAMEPVIKSHREIFIEGVSVEMAFDDIEKAKAVWLEYFKKFKEKRPEYYGVCQGTANDGVPSCRLSYMAGHEERKGLPIGGGDYAVFTHSGALNDITITLDYIWQIWVARSGSKLRNAPDFEVYDQRFDQETLTGDIEIWIPVEI